MIRRTLMLAAFSTGLLSACGPTEEEAIRAITAVNERFKACYEETLSQNGTHTYRNVSTDAAFSAVGAAMKRMEMSTVEADRSIGYLKVSAPAPTPLDEQEWRAAKKDDLPMLRNIVKEHVGFMGNFIKFEPEGLNIVLTITMVESDAGTDISVTLRFEEIAPPKQGYPRRTYPPCNAMRIGLAKVWKTIEEELSRTRA